MSGRPENRTLRGSDISRACDPALDDHTLCHVQSGTLGLNQEPPTPEAGVLPSAPLPVDEEIDAANAIGFARNLKMGGKLRIRMPY